jgi:hypothetical protein
LNTNIIPTRFQLIRDNSFHHFDWKNIFKDNAVKKSVRMGQSLMIIMFPLKHRYLLTGPYGAFDCLSPLFWTSLFFHIHNILQLSMYHCMTCIYNKYNPTVSFYPCRGNQRHHRVLSTSTCTCALKDFINCFIIFWNQN